MQEPWRITRAGRVGLGGCGASAPQVRKYSALSIVQAAFLELAHDYGTPLDNLRAAPWHTLLLVKWAL